MSDLDLVQLSREKPVHFMGIGGAGMCALAELLLREGGRVSGCDAKSGEAEQRLARLGAAVTRGHDPEHASGIGALVVTSAVPGDHAEVAAARASGVPVLKRAQALGSIVNRGRVVAVAGTHGKTSTTAMATGILEAAGMDPTGFVGGTVAAWEGNLRHGSSALFVVEADEYDRSFLTLEPDVAVVTNLEADHLDVYGDLDGVRRGFLEFVGGLRPGGRLVACADDTGASGLLTATSGGYTYGLSAGAQLRAVDVAYDRHGVHFRAMEDGADRGTVRLSVPGRHNLLNALGAAAAARHLGAGWEAVREALAGYAGVGRRLEPLGDAGGVSVLDDYAHHPTEIRATLQAVRAAYPGRRVVVVFQPHLYSRTRDFAREFGLALAGADVVWVTDVFPARERPLPGVDGTLVSNAARDAGCERVLDHPDVDDVHRAVTRDLSAGDVVVTMGAGSVETVGPRILERLREASRG